MRKNPKMNVKDARGLEDNTRDEIELVIHDNGLKVNKGPWELMHLFFHMDLGWVLDYHKEVGIDQRIVFGKDPDITFPKFKDD